MKLVVKWLASNSHGQSYERYDEIFYGSLKELDDIMESVENGWHGHLNFIRHDEDKQKGFDGAGGFYDRLLSVKDEFGNNSDLLKDWYGPVSIFAKII